MPQPFHKRLAELYEVRKRRTLTSEEAQEMDRALQANADYCFETYKLGALAILALKANDSEWVTELKLRIKQHESDG